MDFTFPVPELERNTENTIQVQNQETPDTISTSVERFFQSYSPKTVIAYKQDLRTFEDFSMKPLQDSGEQDILRFIKHLESKGYLSSSINRKIAALSKFYTILISLNIVDRNPVYNLSKISKIYKPIDSQAHFNITRHDVEAVICHARKRTAIIVKFLANTGLRVSEMINISKSDLEAFNTEYMRIKILGKGKKIRFVFIPYDLYQEVKDTYDSESIYLFTSKSGKQLSRVNLYKQIRRAFQSFSHKKNINPHQLRHFFATQKIVEEKMDVKAVSNYLGHASVTTTLQIYTKSELKAEDSQII